MFDLKVDPENPHHYIIGVSMKDMRSDDPGRMFLKYGPVYFENHDVQNVGDSIVLLNDKIYTEIYQMKPGEIYKTLGCNELIMALTGLRIAAQSNAATLHHFSTSDKLPDPDKFFEGYVERANKKDSSERRGLDDSRIHGA
jgi:hypothetical protein